MSSPAPSAEALDAAARRRLAAAAARLATFDPDDYRRLNPDLAEADPWEHFARFGAWEGRVGVSPERLTARLARATALAPAPAPERAEAAYAEAAGLRVAVHLPPDAGPALQAQARRLADLLGDVGAGAEILHGPPPPTPGDAPAGEGVARLLLDPARLFEGARPQGEALGALARAVVGVADAPGTPGFAAALPYALLARGAVCAEGAAWAVLVHAGRPAVWLGAAPRDAGEAEAAPDHPLLAGLSRAARAAPPGLPLAERPIDLAALEDATPARTSAWERMADPFAESGLALVVRRPADAAAHLPHEAQLRRFIYARAKLVLHLHADAPRPVLDVVAAEAADAGACLLAEPSPPHLLLRPGVHVLEASARRMPALASRLAGPDGAPEAAAAARALRARLRRAFDEEGLALALVGLLAELAA